MVVNVNIRSIRRSRTDRAAEERTEIVGAMSLVGRQTAYPAGSLQLRTISEIVFSSKTQRRGITGSVSSPNNLGNSVLIVPIYTGTTGTRLASLATLGSHSAIGTVLASFTAYGY